MLQFTLEVELGEHYFNRNRIVESTNTSQNFRVKFSFEFSEKREVNMIDCDLVLVKVGAK